MRPLWKQALRLARALEGANHAGNKEAARLHHKALIEVLKQIKENNHDDTRRRSQKQKYITEQIDRDVD